MTTIIIAVVVGALIIIGFVNLNQNTAETPSQTLTTMATTRPTMRPVNVTQTPRDPIVGSWLNGMVFYPNGTVGSDGTTTWEANPNENNSYFVVTNVQSSGSNNPRSISSAEWLYNPATDKISRRGSPEIFGRGVPTTKPTTKPTATTVPATVTATVNVTASTAKFSYQDCMNTCKLNYYVDRHIGHYNECVQACNIENLKTAQ